MEKYIILGLLAALVAVPTFLRRAYRARRRSETLREMVSKPFVCPNCSHRFYTEQKIIHPVGENKAFLKCPKCGKRDVCGRPYDFEG